MEYVASVESLKEELELARAEEAEALRRAVRLRAIAASSAEVRDAMREVEASRSRVARLQLELRQLLH